MLLVLLGLIFDDAVDGTRRHRQPGFAAGMIADGIASTAFVNLGVGIAADREDGTLKRLRGTPMPPTSYFIGKVVLVAGGHASAEVALMLAVGVLLFDLPLPDRRRALAHLRLGLRCSA